MFYTERWGLIHIPKTSGNNILSRCCQIPSLQVPWGVGSKPYYPRLSRHNNLAWWEQQLDLAGIQFHGVVRNPYSRIVSLWHHVQREGGRDFTFPQFVQLALYHYRDVKYWLGNSINLKDDIKHYGHLIDWDILETQSDYYDPRITFYKLENELPLLEDAIGVKFTDSYVNKAKDLDDYRYYYDDQSQEIVYNCFKDDFVRYNYSIDL